MTGKPSGYQYLASILTLAVSFFAYAAEVNDGTVEYAYPGDPHTAPDGYENRGDPTATSTSWGDELRITSGGFANYAPSPPAAAATAKYPKLSTCSARTRIDGIPKNGAMIESVAPYADGRG